MALELLGSGRDADVYIVDATRVLRRYRSKSSGGDEARFMRLAHSLGYPTPEVYSADGPDLVMQRLYGPTLLAAICDGVVTVEHGAVQLAELHTRLHRLRVPDQADGHSLVHLDLHPANVILTDSGPFVIDWTNAAFGPAGLDVALSALVFAVFALDKGSELAELARALLVAFLSASTVSPLTHLDEAVERRLGDPNFTDAERSRFGRACELIRMLAEPLVVERRRVS